MCGLAVHAYVKKSAAAAARPGSKTKELEPPVVAAAFHMARIQDQSQVVSWRSWKQPPVETQKPETHSFGPQETTLASTAVITFWLIG